MSDATMDRAAKTMSSELKTADKHATVPRLQSDTKDLKSNQDGLLAAERYYENMKPQRVDNGINYEDRVDRRDHHTAH